MALAGEVGPGQVRGLAMIESPPIQAGIVPLGLSVRWVAADQWPGEAGAWAELARQAEPNAFLAPTFALAARAIDTAPGLGALAVEEAGRLIAWAPGRFGLKGLVFSFWTHPYAPLGAPLIRRGSQAAALGALFDDLAARGVAALRWPLLDESSDLAAGLAAFVAATGRHVDMLDSHRRAMLSTAAVPAPGKELRRLARRLAETGEVVEASTADGLPLDQAIATFLALEAKGWKGRRGTALAARPGTRDLVEAGIAGLAALGQARIDLLIVGGQPIAGGVVLMAGDRAWYWKTAYDEALARFSPGVLMTQAIGRGIARDPAIRVVDSCAIPDHPMIDRVWPERLAMASRLIAVAPGRPGGRYILARAAIRGFAAARARAKAVVVALRRARARAGG
jgi:CelD/BcsL family acetyltransferase involved in cellulose biosynthesis